MDAPPRSAPRRRWLALLLAVAPFVLGELALRVLGFEYPSLEIPIKIWNAEHDAELADEDSLHRFDDEHFWLPREGAALPWFPEEHVSPQGFRGRDPDQRAAARVLALGDSSTFGWKVEGSRTWCALLERALAEELAPTAVQVLNGGVIGSTVRQGIARYRMVARRWRPDVVVVAFGAINEHFPTMDLDDAQKEDWLRRRRQPPARLGQLARDHLRLLHLLSWLHDEARGGREAWFGGFVTNEAARRSDLRRYQELDDYKRRVSPEAFGQALEELRAAIAADGGRMVLLRMPRRRSLETRLPPVLDYDAPMEAFRAKSGTPLVDARAPFRARFDAGTPEDELLFDSVHPTPAGQALIAELLLPVVGEALRSE